MAHAQIELKITGNLLPVASAMSLMAEALQRYGHQWSDEDQAVIDEAAERIYESAGLESRPDLDGRGN